MTSPSLPTPTVEDLLLMGRRALLDPSLGPRVAFAGQARTMLQDVRILGDAKDPDNASQSLGTQNWVPGRNGWPWAMLGAWKAKKSYPETYRAWEDWVGTLHLGLTRHTDGQTSLHSWAVQWDAVLTQWFALHRRFANTANGAGDVYWQYEEAAIEPFSLSGVTSYGLIARLKIHNVVPVTWGV